MLPSEIKNSCEKIESIISEKGYYNPKAYVSIGWLGYDLNMHISYRVDAHSMQQDKFIYATFEDGLDVMFEKAGIFAAELQSIADSHRDAFIAAVAGLIEQGRDIGVEVEFLNPLTDMMSKLSTNIITSSSNVTGEISV